MSQVQTLYEHMLSGKSITTLEAIGLYRIYRLQARIHDLRKWLVKNPDGNYIKSTMCKDHTQKSYCKYSLVNGYQDI